MRLIEILLVTSIFGVCYSYFIYPFILLLLPKRTDLEINFADVNDSNLPFVTLIITAYNEEIRIKEKIINTLSLDYPAHKREILIASDGSSDQTNRLVSEFTSQGVILIEVAERKGKENAQLAAIRAAKGDILVFSDVATHISPEALMIMINAFANPVIGAVSSEDRFITEDGRIAGEGAYVKYEMWLRRQEAKVKSLVGLSGSFFACRKSICDNWNISVPSDFNTALNCVSQGYAAISHPKVLGYYPNLKDENNEYQRKLRTVLRGMAAISSNLRVLNPISFGVYSFEVFSHKIMRWLVPWFMLILLILSISIWHQRTIYTVILTGQVAFYFLAMIGWLYKPSRSSSMFKLPFFFMQVNLAIAHAGIQFIGGKRITLWEPSKR